MSDNQRPRRKSESIQEYVKEWVIPQMKLLQANMDLEVAHREADKLLCDLLMDLGYTDVVEAWDKVEKWYA